MQRSSIILFTPSPTPHDRAILIAEKDISFNFGI